MGRDAWHRGGSIPPSSYRIAPQARTGKGQTAAVRPDGNAGRYEEKENEKMQIMYKFKQIVGIIWMENLSNM